MKIESRIFMSLLVTIFVVLFISGCNQKENTQTGTNDIDTKETNKNNELSTETSESVDRQSFQTVDIDEEIFANFYIKATMEVPQYSLNNYKTTLKNFEIDSLSSLVEDLFGIPANEIPVTMTDEGTLYESQKLSQKDKTLTISRGVLCYNADSTIVDISDFFYAVEAESIDVSTSYELPFMSQEEAKEKALEIIKTLGISSEVNNIQIKSLNCSDLSFVQDALIAKDYYGTSYSKKTFGTGDETYEIRIYFSKDSFEIFNDADPAIMMTGGIDSPEPAYPQQAVIYISDSGIRSVGLYQMLDTEVSVEETKSVIGESGIKEALTVKYGDVILTQSYTVESIRLMYMPIRDIVNYGSIELLPAWCVEIVVEDSTLDNGFYEQTLYINAFTGEEIS
jgi:hypothetical protein